ncbi:F0F1 ATP synthase subunit epsilon [Helicobacter monodelphidis]|uniref:ATP synthase F1 subunit epsilon n=1 Tax=Helicobacter sp. 15-1451 TaxID=2004995 RepID=UPI000DCE64B3|nr:ATP synthase F1 subunit epsilon [Helicobacter sp. 15-1451]RAX56927.1 F0F1 ATP synthase subunit epsilon [Helicobacter sp. 15-1451]
MDTLTLNIVTPEGGIFSGQVRSVLLPGEEGEFGVLPGHSDVLTLLSAGAIEIEREDGKREIVAVNSGYVKVDHKSVDVLADGAVAISGGNDSIIAKALADAKNLLEGAKSDRVIAASVLSRLESAAKTF